MFAKNSIVYENAQKPVCFQPWIKLFKLNVIENLFLFSIIRLILIYQIRKILKNAFLKRAF